MEAPKVQIKAIFGLLLAFLVIIGINFFWEEKLVDESHELIKHLQNINH